MPIPTPSPRRSGKLAGSPAAALPAGRLWPVGGGAALHRRDGGPGGPYLAGLRGPACAGGGLPAEKALLAPGLCQRGRQGLPGLRLPDAGAEKVSSIIKTDNLASIRVAQRNGMVREKEFTAHYYNVPVPHYLYTAWKDDMMNTAYCMEQLKALCAIDSPSGFTDRAADYLIKELSRLGWAPERTRKGGVRVCLGGEGRGLLLMAHVDTLGAVVQTIKANGRLVLSPVGGLRAENCEAENCRIYTRFDGVYTGCLQICNASVHVNDDYAGSKRAFDKMEVVIDQPVRSEQDTRALGICEGDFVCFDPRTAVTESGYIKSRFLDDKLSAAMLLAYAKELKDRGVSPQRKVYLHFTVYEEVGHGAAASVPEDVEELISVDMGCVGEGLRCTEREVSICAKDSGGPYDYAVTTALVEAAKEAGAAYAVDVYPHYGSDAEAALRAGYDVRHGLIGAGVYASHGYERSMWTGWKTP